MTAFLLLLSLILNFLALFAIIVLFLRQNRFIEAEKKRENTFREMEEVIAAFLVQMKEDNEDFINRISKINIRSNHSPKMVKDESKNPGMNVNHEEENHSKYQSRIGKTAAYQAVKAYKQNINKPFNESKNAAIGTDDDIKEFLQLAAQTDNINVSAEISTGKPESIGTLGNSQKDSSFLSQVLRLKNQGLTEKEIAKKLNKGKTEIELLLKFRQNQQE